MSRARDLANRTIASAALPKAGGAMTGAITTNSTFDGIDVATRDGILTSTTTTAGAALPKAGGTMSGAVTGMTGLTGGTGDFNWDSNTLVVDSSESKVGIGTAAPPSTAAIHFTHASEAITHGLTIRNYVNANNGIAPIWFGVSNERSKAAIGLKRSTSYGVGDLVFAVDPNTDNADVTFANDEKMRITSSGKVGIGTTTPDYVLEVVTAGGNPPPTDGSFNGAARFQTSAGNSNALDFGLIQSGAGTEAAWIQSQAATPSTDAADKHNLLLNPNGGNVGIGTTSPGGALDVNSSISDENHINVNATNTSFTGRCIRANSATTASTNWQFLQCYSGNLSDVEFSFYGNGHAATDDGWYTGGADYAEYFESTDGNTIQIGTTVVLENGKVKSASLGEQPIGIVRPSHASALVGNTAWNKWNKKHLRDNYGAYIFEEYTLTEWTDEDEKEHSYQTDLIPADVTVPANVKIISKDEDGNKLERRKINPDFDSTLGYTSREDREEWVVIGLLGQIQITKGQPTASSWIKMREISETVEMWLVK